MLYNLRFVESIQSPSKDPLAFWTNGGPGCSGLIGFLTEQGSLCRYTTTHAFRLLVYIILYRKSWLINITLTLGPFQPNKDMSLKFNDYAWNEVSNMVFIESPG